MTKRKIQKVCTVCGVEKHYTEFTKKTGKCNPCRKEEMAQRRLRLRQEQGKALTDEEIQREKARFHEEVVSKAPERFLTQRQYEEMLADTDNYRFPELPKDLMSYILSDFRDDMRKGCFKKYVFIDDLKAGVSYFRYVL